MEPNGREGGGWVVSVCLLSMCLFVRLGDDDEIRGHAEYRMGCRDGWDGL
jgi:hypothetical protein